LRHDANRIGEILIWTRETINSSLYVIQWATNTYRIDRFARPWSVSFQT
jgi:hypothetical protein